MINLAWFLGFLDSYVEEFGTLGWKSHWTRQAVLVGAWKTAMQRALELSTCRLPWPLKPCPAVILWGCSCFCTVWVSLVRPRLSLTSLLSTGNGSDLTLSLPNLCSAALILSCARKAWWWAWAPTAWHYSWGDVNKPTHPKRRTDDRPKPWHNQSAPWLTRAFTQANAQTRKNKQ